jgi:hypothetical protein
VRMADTALILFKKWAPEIRHQVMADNSCPFISTWQGCGHGRPATTQMTVGVYAG